MRALILLAFCGWCAGCGGEKETVLTGCSDVDDLKPGTPIQTFMTLNGGLSCEFSGSCQYGQAQLICGETSEIKQVKCTCTDGTFECNDTAVEVTQRNAACGS